MKTLYITDLDGTLLDDEARVSAETSRIISQLSRAGALISVATARTPATVEPILADTYTTAQMVVMTGASLWDRRSHRYIGMKLLPTNDVELVVNAMALHGVSLFGYTLSDTGHMDVYHPSASLNEAEQRFVELRRNLELKTFHLSCPLNPADYSRTVLFFGMGSRDGIIALAEYLRSRTDSYVSYYKDTYLPDVWLIEIFAPGVSKAAGILNLKERIGADRVVVFGDNLNDISMFKVADVAVAVDNALPETKAAADVVIGPNTSDSVARFIASDFSHN